MNKFHAVLGILAVTTLGGAAFAHGAGRHGGPGPDANKDGKVTLDELLAASKARFDAKDTNKDGVLSKDELGPRGQGVLEKADTNKDGKITAAEQEASVRAKFSAKDTNKDGVLSGDELRHGPHGRGHGKHRGQDA